MLSPPGLIQPANLRALRIACRGPASAADLRHCTRSSQGSNLAAGRPSTWLAAATSHRPTWSNCLKSHPLFRSAALFRVAVLCAVLSACGGGGGEPEGAAAPPPAPAPAPSPGPAPAPSPQSAYLLHSGKVEVCRIDGDGLLVDCADAGVAGFTALTGMAAAESHVYMANINGQDTSEIIRCSIGATGAFPDCNVAVPTYSANSYGLAVNGSTLYFGTDVAPLVRKCPIQADGSLGACTDAGFPGELATSVEDIRLVGTTAYILHYEADKVSKCTVRDDGSLASCEDARATGLQSPEGFAIHGSHMYIANSGDDNVVHCSIGADGLLGNCMDAGASGVSSPTQVAVRGSTVYITGADEFAGLTRCTAGTDGLLGNCTNISGTPKALYSIVLK